MKTQPFSFSCSLITVTNPWWVQVPRLSRLATASIVLAVSSNSGASLSLVTNSAAVNSEVISSEAISSKAVNSAPIAAATLLADYPYSPDSSILANDTMASYGLSVSQTDAPSGATSTTRYTAAERPLGNYAPYRRSNQPLTVPDLGRQGIGFADQHQNRLIGEWSLQRLNGQINALHDPWVQTLLSDITWQLNAQVRQQAPLALVIVNDPNINAFAIPGGVIGLNTGTITAAKSMDEVASVLAHEVAHLSQRHYEHSDEAKRKALLLQIGGLLAAIAASTADGDAAAAIMMGSQTAALDSQMAFSRDNEREADRVGMQIMTQAGFDPKAMPRFFATLNMQSQLNQAANSFLPSFVRSHPLSDERLSEAQTRAQQYPSIPLRQQTTNQRNFDLLYWRVQLLSNQASEQRLETAAKNSTGAKLALVSWYAKQQRYQAADRLLTTLMQQPNSELQKLEPLLSITRSDLARAQGDWQSAADILRTQHQLYPERRDLRLYLAQAYIALGRASEAQTLLKPLIQNQESDLQAWQGLQQANDYLAKHATDPVLQQIATINALRYRSHEELWRGRYDDALVSLTQALRLAKPTSNNSNNLRSLVATIDSEIKAVKTAKEFKP